MGTIFLSITCIAMNMCYGERSVGYHVCEAMGGELYGDASRFCGDYLASVPISAQ
jgi:hypothetical protein